MQYNIRPLCRTIYHPNSEWLLEVPIQQESLLCCNLPTETMPRLLPFNPHSRLFVPSDILSWLYKLRPNLAQSCAVVQGASFIKRDVTVSNNKSFRNFVFTYRQPSRLADLLRAPKKSVHFPQLIDHCIYIPIVC